MPLMHSWPRAYQLFMLQHRYVSDVIEHDRFNQARGWRTFMSSKSAEDTPMMRMAGMVMRLHMFNWSRSRYLYVFPGQHGPGLGDRPTAWRHKLACTWRTS